jgi:hypothetical protein
MHGNFNSRSVPGAFGSFQEPSGSCLKAQGKLSQGFRMLPESFWKAPGGVGTPFLVNYT